MDVAIGIDSHKSSLAAAVLDVLGRVIDAREFSNDERGHISLLEWARAQAQNRVIGIEGAGSYGAGLARLLLQAGEDVREVPAFLTHRERKRSPSRGKSDPADAVAIARVAARGEGLSSPERFDVFEDLKMLTDHRDQLVCARTRLINRTHKDLVISHPGYEKRIPKLNSKKNLTAALALLRGDISVRARLIRERVAEIRRLDSKIAAVEKDIAMLSGTAPLEASSGATKRHRLNRGGNRQLNYALHMMARARLNRDADTKSYVARLRIEGKSEKEAMRCLKRHLSNVVYRQLVIDLMEAANAA